MHFQSTHGLVGILAFALLLCNQAGMLIFTASSRLVPDAVRSNYRPLHAFLGTVALVFGLVATITGNESLAGRGDNHSAKDLLFKAASLLTILLVPALGLVFTYPRHWGGASDNPFMV